jgi:cytidylate kinase
MGTIVFTDAPLKIYLTASAEARAERRYKQLMEKGLPASLRDLFESIRDRDARDMNRAVAPLRPADDAITVDSTDVDAAAVFETVLTLVRDRGFDV